MSLFKKLTVLLVLVVAMFGFAAPNAAVAATADDEAAFLRDINSLRASKGLPAYRLNSQLNALAFNWANQMVANGKISHNPNLAKLGPSGWTKLGENVGIGGEEATLHTAFVNSPGHYANLIDPQFNQIGISVIYANGRLWTVHVFMTSNATSPVSPTAAAPAESEASKYLRHLSERMPAAANVRSLRARAAVGL
jgi:uncharacterized protein YkwD